ncbi:MAG: cation diffusion facilitator family transporter [Bacillota bacterium]
MTNSCSSIPDHQSHECDHYWDDQGHAQSSLIHVAQSKLKLAVVLGSLILIAEIIGGLLANSLALLSDAGHMFTDVASLVIALLAVRISTSPPSKTMTYGYHRITILAALLNALTLVGIAIFISIEAYRRILNPMPVHGAVLFITASLGIVINLYIGLGMRGGAENVNIKSAMLHVFGDAAASAGVIVAGIVMIFTRWYIIDPLLSILIAVVVAVGAWRIIKETYRVLMEGTPEGIDLVDVVDSIIVIPGILDLHDMHLWSLTSNRNAMSAHIVVDGNLKVKEIQVIIRQVEAMLSDKYRIGHITVQVEDDAHPHENDLFALDRKWEH